MGLALLMVVRKTLGHGTADLRYDDGTVHGLHRT
jgi:hypothetical protein